MNELIEGDFRVVGEPPPEELEGYEKRIRWLARIVFSIPPRFLYPLIIVLVVRGLPALFQTGH